MSLHSVYNIVALVAFALGAAALITAAILFVSQRLWEVMSVWHKRPASARRTTGHTAQVRTPPQPTGGRNTSVLNQSTNTANGTRPANDPESFAPGITPLTAAFPASISPASCWLFPCWILPAPWKSPASWNLPPMWT